MATSIKDSNNRGQKYYFFCTSFIIKSENIELKLGLYLAPQR